MAGKRLDELTLGEWTLAVCFCQLLLPRRWLYEYHDIAVKSAHEVTEISHSDLAARLDAHPRCEQVSALMEGLAGSFSGSLSELFDVACDLLD